MRFVWFESLIKAFLLVFIGCQSSSSPSTPDDREALYQALR
jgi:hypothetical protein